MGTMTAEHLDKIREIIRGVIEKRLNMVDIVSINISEETDADGDPILNVRVVFEAEKGKLKASDTTSLARSVIPKLAEVNEKGFPIFSFISRKDLGKTKPAAA